MIRLIKSLDLQVDFEMYSESFCRTENAEGFSVYFINMKGNLLCIQTETNGRCKKKSFYLDNFNSLPTRTLIKKYQKLMEETPWVLL